MTLRKKIVDIPLGGGLNSKTSDKNLTAPDFLELRNVRLAKEGQIDKRYGFDNLGVAVNTGTLNTPTALSSINDELLMFSADRLYSRSDTDSKWYSKGSATHTSTKLAKITASPISAGGIDVIVQDNIKVAVWVEGSNSFYSIYDQETQATIVDRATLVSAENTTYSRLASISGNIYIFYHRDSTTNLTYLRIPTSAPTATSTGSVYTTMDVNAQFDAIGYGSYIYLFFKVTAATTLRISKLDATMAVVATNTISEAAGTYANTCINAFASTSLGYDVIVCGWVDGSNNIRMAAYNVNLAAVLTPRTVETLASVEKLIAVIDDTTGASVRMIYSVSNATPSKYYVKGTNVTFAGVTGTPTVIMRSVGLASRACYHNSVSYFNVLHESTLQATYFTLSTDNKVIAKFAAGEAGTHASTLRASNLAAVDTTSYVWGAYKKGRIRSENATLFADRSPHFATIIFDTSKAYISTPSQDNLLVAGGTVTSYDGKSTTEFGFHLYPEGVTATPSASGGLVADGTYLIYAVYEWIDNHGVRYQSAPSTAVTATVSGGGGLGRIFGTVPYLRITDKYTSPYVDLNARANAIIRFFVTEAGGTVPYAYTTTYDNNPTQDELSYEIGGLANLSSNEILYTSGGTLENIAPPSASYIFTHDNRIILCGLENRNQVALSKDIKPGVGVGFNEDLVLNLDPIGGNIVAGASMDGNMIFFKETAILAVSGSGPNDLGQGSTLGAPQVISSDVGCVDPKSVLQMPDGIIFKSKKGIYILDRSLGLNYIGAKVERYNSATIRSTDILKDINEVRFATDNDIILVYNYDFKRWSVTDAVGALDATIWKNNSYVYLTSTKVLKESSTSWLDDGSYVSTRIRTGWLHLAGMQGFQRIYKMLLLGTYHTNHSFQIKHYFDYSEIMHSATTVTASSLVNTDTYGAGATWGSDGFWGGSSTDEVYQLTDHMPRQQCQSVSFELTDSIVGSVNGRGFSLEGISLLVGIKSGVQRMPAARNV